MKRYDARNGIARWWHSRRPPRWPAPRFVQASASASLAVRLALGASLAVVTVTGLQAWNAWQTLQHDLAQQALASQQLEIVRQQRLARAVTPALPAKGAAKADAAQAQQISAGMRSAWAHVLLPLEEAGSADVRWLGLEHAAGKGQLRISGLTSHLEPLLGAMQRLSVQPGWSDITLTQLQTPAPSASLARTQAQPVPQSPHALRFELQAQFDGTVFP